MKVYSIFKIKLGRKQAENKAILGPGYTCHWPGNQEFIAALLWCWMDYIHK